jgi:acyl-CoA thioesterase-2
MGNFLADTALTGGNGRYRAMISPEWQVWGPLGGYVAAIAMRAIGLETPLRRPASISCQFLSMAAFEEADVEVTTLRKGKKSHALHVRISQKGTPVLAASGWVVEEGMTGFVHDHGSMPKVALPSGLKSYRELADDYDRWYPVWRATLDAKPTEWRDWSKEVIPGPPIWRTWLRLQEPVALDDPFLDAARSLMWMDLMMYNGALQPHVRNGPISHLAPNLDVSAIFLARATDDEWLLCDCWAPVARDGIVGCNGQVWTPSGRLVAAGSSCLFCRPNPEFTEASA